MVSGAADFEGGELIADGTGGAICTWFHPYGSSDVLMAQRIDADGSIQWEMGGAFLAGPVRAPQALPPAMIGDGQGGLIGAWEQNGPADVDLYAQHIGSSGIVLAVEPAATANDLSLSVSPNPCAGPAVLSIVSGTERNVRLTILDLQGRIVRDFGTTNVGPGRRSFIWDRSSRPSGSGIYFARLVSNGKTNMTRFAVVR